MHPIKNNLLLSFLCALALTGCAALQNPFAPEGPLPACPDAGFMAGAETTAFFPADIPADPMPQDAVVYAEIKNLKGECAEAGGGIMIDFSFDILAQKTAQGEKLERQEVSYFISLLDRDEDILQRERFFVTLDFGKNATAMTTPEHRIKIPFSSTSGVSADKIVVGFTLTPQQADFNAAYPRPLDSSPVPRP